MIENPKIGQEVWFAEACNQRIHSAKLIALDEVEVSTRKYLYAKIEMDDGCRLGWPLKNLYASRKELQKELEKKKKGRRVGLPVFLFSCRKKAGMPASSHA